MNFGVPGGSPTKELWVPVTAGHDIATAGTKPVAICDAVPEQGAISFKVPHDFNSIVSAEIIVIPTATQAAADWDIFSEYGAVGEVQNIHNETDNVSTYNVTSPNFTAVNIAGILSNLAADDYVGVLIQQHTAGHNFYILGVRLRYA